MQLTQREIDAAHRLAEALLARRTDSDDPRLAQSVAAWPSLASVVKPGIAAMAGDDGRS